MSFRVRYLKLAVCKDAHFAWVISVVSLAWIATSATPNLKSNYYSAIARAGRHERLHKPHGATVPKETACWSIHEATVPSLPPIALSALWATSA